MLIRLFSDLHLEKDTLGVKRPSVANLWVPVALPTDPETVLVLAGDIWNGTRPLGFAGQSWLALMASRFKAVVAVLGNHDVWGDNVHFLPGKWREGIAAAQLSNVFLLEAADGVEHASVVIDGLRFVGGTLWTDMNKDNPLVSSKFDFELGGDGRALWNDQNFIRATANYHAFKSQHWRARHHHTVAQMKLAFGQGDEPVFWVTHHAPCMVSAPPRGKDALASYLYASDLADFIFDAGRIVQVVHGHTHEALDYMMGDVPVRCNPRGYAPASLVSGFDPNGFVELNV